MSRMLVAFRLPWTGHGRKVVSEPGSGNSPVDNTGNTREVFARFYEECMPKVYRYIHYRVTNIHLAEDLTSAVFEKALDGFKRYRSSQASFLTWLMTIARNTVIDYYRRQDKRKTVPLEEIGDMSSDNPSPEQSVIHREQLHILKVCMAGLSPQEQEIISCKFGAEMTNRQIAVIISLTESNIGTILYRAVRRLRDCFRKWQNGR